MVRPGMAPQVGVFLAQRHFAVLTTLDEQERPWASVVVGVPGFIRAQDPYTVAISGGWASSDILLSNLEGQEQIGMLAIDFNNRRRVRINGTGSLRDGVLVIRAQQVYSNCPKYIQARIPQELRPTGETNAVVSESLNETQRQWIARADTFFIASTHPEFGADASHRGGNPGFIHVQDARKLVIPDYNGNNLFNTLGNIQINPQAGLLFVDFEQGRTLQLTGRASINWDEQARSGFPGAQRLVEFETDEVRETENGAPLRFELRTYSPFNPPL